MLEVQYGFVQLYEKNCITYVFVAKKNINNI